MGRCAQLRNASAGSSLRRGVFVALGARYFRYTVTKHLIGACLSMNQLNFSGVNRRAFLSATAVVALAAPTAIFMGSNALAQQANERRGAAGRMAAELRNIRTPRRQSRDDPGSVAGDARRDRRGDPAISGHRFARRLERGAGGRRTQGRREIEGGAGLAAAAGRLRRSRSGRGLRRRCSIPSSRPRSSASRRVTG